MWSKSVVHVETGEKLLLMDPLHSMLDEKSAQQVRALVAKGTA